MTLAGADLPIRPAAPWEGFTYHEAMLRNLRQLGYVIEQMGQALVGLKTSLVSLANVVPDNQLALDYLLAEQGGVCAIINTSSCTWINATGKVEFNIKEIYAQVEWLHNFGRGDITATVWLTVKEALPKLTWFLPLLGPLITIVVLLPLGACLFNLLVKFVSSRLQQFEVSLMMPQGIQPIPAESGPGPYRFLEKSVRDFYTSRVGYDLQPLSSRKKFQKRPSAPYPLRIRGVESLSGE